MVLIAPDGRSAQFVNGRYLDRMERRDGQWRIVIRHSTVEGMFIADSRVLQSLFFAEKVPGRYTRSHRPAYDRPLSMDTPAPARW